MKACWITITCLGEQHHLLRAVRHNFDAVIWAMERFPQACRISARTIGPATAPEARHV